MELVNRKVTYRLYPSKGQEKKLLETRRLHQQLYNAALQERIDAYKKCGISITRRDQEKSLTTVRAENEEYRALNAQSLQVTLKRLDLAFQHFFRRVKNGEMPGFPRFKSLKRFSGWGYKTHGDGWKLHAGEKMKHGSIRISGIGMVRMRGGARTEGIPKTCEILYKNGKWYASVTIQCMPKRECGRAACGLDWGTKNLLTIVSVDGSTDVIENPRHTQKASTKLKKTQRELSKKKRFSSNWNKARKKVSDIHRKVSNVRKDFVHQLTSKLTPQYCLFSTEKLHVKHMTSSARGTKESPGKNVKQKSGLNREILSTSPSFLFQTLKYKAEEAGCEWVEINTSEEKPSQTCSCCGAQRKKALSERTHHCDMCGSRIDRDENAARVMLNLALFDSATGLEQSWRGGGALVSPMKHESPAIPLG